MFRSFALVFLFSLLSSPLFAQYTASKGMNAPKTESVEETYREKGTNKLKKRTLTKSVVHDSYGNAAGNQHDLAVDGAFDGQTIAVLHLYVDSSFDFSLPKKALAEKGFSVYRWIGNAPSEEELEEKLKKACQLWIISDGTRKLSDGHVKIIKKFFNSGKGVYIWGDNEPFYADANVVAKALIGSGMDGNLPGNKVVDADFKHKKKGLRVGHDITTGLEFMYEGITIATLRPTKGLEPILYGSAGNLVTAVYEKKGKRMILDGGFTRLYNSWDEAGTARYVKNAASWLVNYERFGDKVVGEDIRKENEAKMKKKKKDAISNRVNK